MRLRSAGLSYVIADSAGGQWTAYYVRSPELLAVLDHFPIDKLTEEQQFDKLRVLQVSFIRQGTPSATRPSIWK